MPLDVAGRDPVIVGRARTRPGRAEHARVLRRSRTTCARARRSTPSRSPSAGSARRRWCGERGARFRLTVAYDGTDFHGWQKPAGAAHGAGRARARRSAAALGGEAVTVNGAGRTDAGVHARGQVASFRSRDRAAGAGGRGARAAASCRRDVRIVEAREAAAGFHARHSRACAPLRLPAARARTTSCSGRFAWWPMKPLDGEALNRAVAPLVGRARLLARSRRPAARPRTRCAGHARALGARARAGWRFDVKADHFLYHMVRNLVGTALRAQRRRPDPARARRGGAGLARPRPRGAAPRRARGLCLEEVEYEDGEDSPHDAGFVARCRRLAPSLRALAAAVAAAAAQAPPPAAATAKPGDISDSRRSAIVSAAQRVSPAVVSVSVDDDARRARRPVRRAAARRVLRPVLPAQRVPAEDAGHGLGGDRGRRPGSCSRTRTSSATPTRSR